MRRSARRRSEASPLSGKQPPRARSTVSRSVSGPRILGGEFRGRRLNVARGVRPTESRLREALFSIWYDRIEGCRFLDLFAGSGAMGLEALSRGGRRSVFVEHAPPVLAALHRNLEGIDPRAARIVRATLPGEAEQLASEEPFDVIFADPPYEFSDYPSLLRSLVGQVTPAGEIVVEHACRVELAPELPPWQRTDHRRYGDSCLSFYRVDLGTEAGELP